MAIEFDYWFDNLAPQPPLDPPELDEPTFEEREEQYWDELRGPATGWDHRLVRAIERNINPLDIAAIVGQNKGDWSRIGVEIQSLVDAEIDELAAIS